VKVRKIVDCLKTQKKKKKKKKERETKPTFSHALFFRKTA
jgi:hypothetical protein